MSIKILHVISNMAVGGAQKLLIDILENTDNKNFKFYVISLHRNKKTIFDKKLTEIGVKVYYLDKRKGIDVSLTNKLNSLIKIINPNVIHTHLNVNKYLFYSQEFRKIEKKIHTVHTFADVEFSFLDKYFQNKVYKNGTIPIAISNQVAKSVEKVYKLDKCIVVNNGINLKKYSWKFHYINKDRVKIVSVGRLDKQKNHIIAIEAIKNLIFKGYNIEYKIIGDGPLKKELEYFIRKFNVEKNIKLLGIKDKVYDELSKNDIFLMPSLKEGFGLAMIEAMAAGLPIICSNIPVFADIIKEKINGILVPENSSNQFEKAIEIIINDSKLYQEISYNNFKESKKYDIKNTCKKYKNIYLN